MMYKTMLIASITIVAFGARAAQPASGSTLGVSEQSAYLRRAGRKLIHQKTPRRTSTSETLHKRRRLQVENNEGLIIAGAGVGLIAGLCVALPVGTTDGGYHAAIIFGGLSITAWALFIWAISFKGIIGQHGEAHQVIYGLSGFISVACGISATIILGAKGISSHWDKSIQESFWTSDYGTAFHILWITGVSLYFINVFLAMFPDLKPGRTACVIGGLAFAVTAGIFSHSEPGEVTYLFNGHGTLGAIGMILGIAVGVTMIVGALANFDGKFGNGGWGGIFLWLLCISTFVGSGALMVGLNCIPKVDFSSYLQGLADHDAENYATNPLLVQILLGAGTAFLGLAVIIFMVKMIFRVNNCGKKDE